MTTIRQIERLWTAKTYTKLAENLLTARPEASDRLAADLARATPVAAMVLIRLDELSQAHVPLCQRLIRLLLAAQQPDGGWDDPLTTALCLRALLCSNGHGAAIDAGLKYLANLQKQEGIWPKSPAPRSPADPYVSAFILFALAEYPEFRAAVRLTDAADWFYANQSSLDPAAKKLWHSATARCRRLQQTTPTLWS